MYLNEVLGVYVERKQGLKKSSVEQIEYSIKAFERYHGRKIKVEDINDELMAEFVKARSKRCVASTVARNVSCVMLLIRFAIMRLKKQIELPYVDQICEPYTIPTAWTVEEIGAIVMAAMNLPGKMRRSSVPRSVWWSALLLFLYDSGARIQAALSINVKDVDMIARTVVLRGEHSKTGKEQLISLSEETCLAVQSLVTAQKKSERNVFVYPWSKRKIWMDFKEIMEIAEVRTDRYVAFHRIRKTHATQQVVAVGWEQARVALGHSSESMTKRYVDIRQIPRTPLSIPRPSVQRQG